MYRGIPEELPLLGDPGDAIGTGIQYTRDAEIGEHHAVGVSLSKHVPGPHVAVNDSFLVSGGQSGCHLAKNLAGLLDPHRPLGLEGVVEIPSLDVLHDDEGCLVLHGADSVYRGHVSMVDLGGRASLALEALPRDLVSRQLGLHHLDGDHPGQGRLPGETYFRHRAVSQQTHDLEVGRQLGLKLSLCF